jgi:hypothetical protein
MVENVVAGQVRVVAPQVAVSVVDNLWEFGLVGVRDSSWEAVRDGAIEGVLEILLDDGEIGRRVADEVYGRVRGWLWDLSSVVRFRDPEFGEGAYDVEFGPVRVEVGWEAGVVARVTVVRGARWVWIGQTLSDGSGDVETDGFGVGQNHGHEWSCRCERESALGVVFDDLIPEGGEWLSAVRGFVVGVLSCK